MIAVAGAVLLAAASQTTPAPDARPQLEHPLPAPDEPIRERTGPNAGTTAIPSFPAPPGPGIVPLPPAPPSQSAASPPGGGMVTLGGVHVTTEPAGAVAQPQADWRPQAGGETGVHLYHAPGQPLDAAWVRRQFEVNGLIGQPQPLDRFAALIQLINLAYVRNGYLNSGLLIAPQSLSDGGTLELRLVMGRAVAAAAGQRPVAVGFGRGGARGLSEEYVRDRLPAASHTPLNAVALEREFRLLASDPAISSINADLRPGQRPGEALVRFTVVPQSRLDLYASYANSRSPSIGGERWSVGGSFRNLATAGDVLSAEYGSTSGRGDLFGTYEVPVFPPGTLLMVRGGKNDAAVVDSQLRGLDIRSTEWVVEGGVSERLLNRPLMPGPPGTAASPAETLTVGLRYGHREQRTSLLGEPFSLSPGATNGLAAYDAGRLTLDYVRRGERQVLAFSFTGTLGLGGTRSDVPGVLSPDKNFVALLAQLSFAQRLDANGLELRLRLVGQYAGGTLYSSERFSVGGENSVRGYRENLLLADEGVFGSIELVRSFSLTNAHRSRDAFDFGAFSVSAFLDGATVHNRGGLEPSPKTIGSVGASLGWEPSPAISGRVTYGKALKDAHPAGKRDLEDRGVSFRIIVRPLLLLSRFDKPSG